MFRLSVDCWKEFYKLVHESSNVCLKINVLQFDQVTIPVLFFF